MSAAALYDHEFMRVPGATAIIDPVILPEMESAVGVMAVSGAGFRVATVSEGAVQHMSAMRALRLAQELEATEHAAALKPFSEALRKMSRIVALATDEQRVTRPAAA